VNNEQQAFHAAMAADHNDHVTRLVYADWLDEHGHPEQAALLRKWATVLPHLAHVPPYDPAKDPEPKPSGLGHPWVQLAMQHHWRTVGATAPHSNPHFQDAMARLWPNDELHALGLPIADDRDNEAYVRVSDRAHFGPNVGSYGTQLHALAVERLLRDEPTKLAAIEPSNRPQGTVLVKVPNPDPPAAPTPQSKPAPATDKTTGGTTPVWILPQ